MRIEKLTEQDKGRRVRWKEGKGLFREEYGVITSYNERYVFVRYGSDAHSKGTSPTELEFDSAERQGDEGNG